MTTLREICLSDKKPRRIKVKDWILVFVPCYQAYVVENEELDRILEYHNFLKLENEEIEILENKLMEIV